MDLLTALDQTFDHTHSVVAGIGPDQLDLDTPCAGWTVRDLLEHTIGVVENLGAAASGEAPRPFALSDDPAAQLRAAGDAAMAGWRRPGVLDQTIDAGAGPLPGSVLAGINLLDTATHAWDLAVATGQPADLPAGVAEAALEASHGIVDDDLRPGRFGPEVPAPDGASPTEALAAFLGRNP